MRRSWRVVETGCADGATNMAIDEALLESFLAGQSPPTVRLYGWCPPCVSVGYFQSLLAEVRLDRCREAGVEWVRRPTGGRLILHDVELTYSVVASEQEPLVSGGIVESYRKISTALAAGLEILGVNAQFADPSDPKVAAAARAKGGLCFDAAAGYELTVNGRKIAGSAQLRRRGAILQHGSLLIDVNIPLLHAVVRSAGEKTLAEFAAEFEDEVISLRHVMGIRPDLSEVAAAVRWGFVRAWGIDLVEGGLSVDESRRATALRRKYASDQWNLGSEGR